MTTRHVTSDDGTPLAFDRLGAGPPLIVIGGMLCDRQTTRPLAEKLAELVPAGRLRATTDYADAVPGADADVPPPGPAARGSPGPSRRRHALGRRRRRRNA